MRDCITNSFRKSVLERVLTLRPKLALYTKMAQHDDCCARYSPANEVRGEGYTPGGIELEGGVVLPTEDGFALLFHSPVWRNATITARSGVIYLADDGGRAMRVIDLGGDITSTNGNFTVKMPGADTGGVISL